MKHTLIALVVAAAASLSACSSAPKQCPVSVDGKSVKTTECATKKCDKKDKNCKSKKDCKTKCDKKC